MGNKRIQIAGAVVAAAVAIGGFSANAATAHDNPRAGAKLSDSDIVRGIAFGRGPAMKPLGLPAVHVKGVTDQKLDAQIDRVIGDINTHDRAGLHQAAQNLRSGDVYKVNTALDETAQLVSGSVKRLDPAAVKQFANHPDAPGCGAVAVCVVEVVAAAGAAVVVSVGAAVTATAALYCGKWIWNSCSSSRIEGKSITKDEFAARVARAL